MGRIPKLQKQKALEDERVDKDTQNNNITIISGAVTTQKGADSTKGMSQSDIHSISALMYVCYLSDSLVMFCAKYQQSCLLSATSVNDVSALSPVAIMYPSACMQVGLHLVSVCF